MQSLAQDELVVAREKEAHLNDKIVTLETVKDQQNFTINQLQEDLKGSKLGKYPKLNKHLTCP